MTDLVSMVRKVDSRLPLTGSKVATVIGTPGPVYSPID